MQKSKTGGGLGAMAGAQTEAVLGANASNVLAKMTAWLVVAFLTITLAVGILTGHKTKNQQKSLADQIIVKEDATGPKRIKPSKEKTTKIEKKTTKTTK